MILDMQYIYSILYDKPESDAFYLEMDKTGNALSHGDSPDKFDLKLQMIRNNIKCLD